MLRENYWPMRFVDIHGNWICNKLAFGSDDCVWRRVSFLLPEISFWRASITEAELKIVDLI